MPSGKAHPHIDRPTEDQVRDAVAGRSPEVAEVYLALHRLVLETLPDVAYSVDLKDAQIGYAERQWGYDGWGMAALAPFGKWASLGFLRGAKLDDPRGLLEGTGALVRHVKVPSVDRLAKIADDVRALLRQAARLNEE